MRKKRFPAGTKDPPGRIPQPAFDPEQITRRRISMKKSNRLLSFLLCCAMLIGLLPTTAFAAGDGTSETTAIEVTDYPSLNHGSSPVAVWQNGEEKCWRKWKEKKRPLPSPPTRGGSMMYRELVLPIEQSVVYTPLPCGGVRGRVCQVFPP